jgi:hypothetical protein
MANLLVGLRLTLFGGKPIAPPDEIPDLVDREVACATTRSSGGKRPSGGAWPYSARELFAAFPVISLHS